MQLTVTFSGKNIRLPIATSQTVQGLIYRALESDKRFSFDVHNNGQIYDKRTFKLFCFSELKGQYYVDIEEKEIIYRTDATLEIRSTRPYLIQTLFSYFSSQNSVKLGNNTVTVSDLILNDKHIVESALTVKTISPITVYMTCEDGHTIYYSPNDQRFYHAIETNAQRKWLSCHEGDEVPFFKISPHTNTRYTSRMTSFKNTHITAWHGTFLLEGDPRMLDFLYQTGLGSKNSQGFGLFKCEKSDK